MDKRLSSLEEQIRNALQGETPLDEGLPTSLFIQLKETLEAMGGLEHHPLSEGLQGQIHDWFDHEDVQAIVKNTDFSLAPQNFPDQVIEYIHDRSDEEFGLLLQGMAPLQAPPRLAAQVVGRIQDDLLASHLQVLKTRAPEGFSSRVLQHIQAQSEAELGTALQALPELKVPLDFKSKLMERMQEDALSAALSNLKAEAPPRFADQVLHHIEAQADQEFSTALQGLPALQAPEGFASHVASRIHQDAHKQDTHNPAPLYLVGMALLAAAFALFSFVLPNMQVGVGVLLDLVGNISGPTVGMLVALAGVSLFSLFSRVRFAPQLTYAAFAVGMLSLYPSLQASFGGLTVPPQQTAAEVVRVGGDVVVRGHVKGDVVAIAGDVTLVQGARVDGRTVSILGDVRSDPSTQVASEPTAILGRVNGQVPHQTTSIAPVGVASAFVPLLDLMQAEYWPALYFAFLCVFTLLVYQSGHGNALIRQASSRGNRNLALGYVAFLVALPLVLLSTFAGNGLMLGLGIFLLVALSAGFSVSLLLLGAALAPRFRVPTHPVVCALIGLTLYLLVLPFPAVSTVLWVLGGCFGLGALLGYFRRVNVTHLKTA